MNWFLKLIGAEAEIAEAKERANRQVEALQGEIDTLENRIRSNNGAISDIIGLINKLRKQQDTILDQVTMPSRGVSQDEISKAMVTMLQTVHQLGDEVDILNQRVVTLETDHVSGEVSTNRLDEEIDELDIRISSLESFCNNQKLSG